MTGCGCASPFHPGSSQKAFANVYRGSFSARTSPPSGWAAPQGAHPAPRSPQESLGSQTGLWGGFHQPAAAHSKPYFCCVCCLYIKYQFRVWGHGGWKSGWVLGPKCKLYLSRRALLAGGGEVNGLHATDVSHVPESCTRKCLVTMVLEVALDFTQAERAVCESGRLHLSLKAPE